MHNDSNINAALDAYADKFLSRIETMPSGCQEWRGIMDASGYGVFNMEADGRQRRFGAHRVAYELKHRAGILGDRDKIIRHKCDNPACVNPDHLEVGTHWDNVRDRCARGRTAIGQNNGRNKLGNAGAKIALHLMREGIMTARQLAKIADVDTASLAHLRDGKTWRFLHDGGSAQ